MSGQGKKEDDLEPSSSATGYRVSSKKTLEELQRLDAHDGIYVLRMYMCNFSLTGWMQIESLQKWKASLGLRGGTPVSI